MRQGDVRHRPYDGRDQHPFVVLGLDYRHQDGAQMFSSMIPQHMLQGTRDGARMARGVLADRDGPSPAGSTKGSRSERR